VPGLVPALGVRDVPGQGLALDTPRGEVRLGSRAWCGVAEGEGSGPELWLARPGTKPTRFLFHDRVRQDAAEVVQQLTLRGYGRELLSGDRAATVAEVAAAIGIETWQAAVTPANKVERLAELARQGRRVLMVGDGLNDAPALAAAYVSMSPSSAADVSQTAADLVFQGRHLAAVTEALAVAKACEGLVRQNLAFSLLYNALAVPLAVAGLVTPLIAAVAMSSSSMVVILNAMRLGRRRRT
jgi:Cu2+-exporting ATPase